MRRGRKRYFILVLVVMICLTVFSSGILAHAEEKERSQETYYKYFTTIQVEAGDTLWGIADRYLCEQSGSREEYIRELQQLNGLKGDNIQIGQYLVVVYYSTEYKR